MKTKVILIAFENDLDIKYLLNYFDGNRYKVEVSKSVSDAIRKIRKGKIDVIVLDDEIEGVKACDIVPLFKRINEKIQIIVVSGEESFGFVKSLRDAGIFYHALKPIDLEEIQSAVKCAFEKIRRESPKEWYVPFFIPRRVPV